MCLNYKNKNRTEFDGKMKVVCLIKPLHVLLDPDNTNTKLNTR